MRSPVPESDSNSVLRPACRLSSNVGTSEPQLSHLSEQQPSQDSPILHEDEAAGRSQKQKPAALLKEGARNGASAAVGQLSGSPGLPAAMAGAEAEAAEAHVTTQARDSPIPPAPEQTAPDQAEPNGEGGQGGGGSLGSIAGTVSGTAPFSEDCLAGHPDSHNGSHDNSHDDPLAPPEAATDGPASLLQPAHGSVELPEDDGMTALRQRILAVQSRDIALQEKARMMHGLLMEGYNRALRLHVNLRSLAPSSPMVAAATIPAQPASAAFGPLESLKFWHGSLTSSTPPPPARTFALTEADLRPTYVPLASSAMGEARTPSRELSSAAANAAAAAATAAAAGDLSPGTTLRKVAEAGGGGDDGASFPFADGATRMLGCEHYRRNVKMQCVTCEHWYTCRLCHDEVEDHVLPRRSTKNMLCMLCGHAQRASDVCAKCGELAARYYCNICKLWNDDPHKTVYHCNDCGICRVGEGLGKDFFHCKKCGSCIAIHLEASHRCREGVMDCDCPICGEYLFTSYKKMVTMKCGHMIHDDCRAQYIKQSYKCPICSKSVENMESIFRRLDKHLEEQPMPPEYKDTRAVVLCNDCEAKTSTKYHWGGLRCELCLSYNTVELHLLNSPKAHGGGAEAEQGASIGQEQDQQQGPSLTSGIAQQLAVSTALASEPETAAHPAQRPMPLLLSPTLPSSPTLSSPSHARPLFRSVSPLPISSPPSSKRVMATPPPGYSERGFEPEEDSDSETENILGLWSDRRSPTLSFPIWNLHGGSHKDGNKDDGEDEEESESEEEDEDDDDDDDDDEEEEQIALFGHR